MNTNTLATKNRIASGFSVNISKKQTLPITNARFAKNARIQSGQDIPILCNVTGIPVVLSVPSINGFSANSGKILEWNSPLAENRICRSLIAEGENFLKKQENIILAGILITVATHYELLQFAPTSSGIEKNAILRTASKELLIEAILFIEHHISSGTYDKFPRLSLIFPSSIIASYDTVQGRIREWLFLCKDILNGFYAKDARISYQNSSSSSTGTNRKQKILSKEAKATKEQKKTKDAAITLLWKDGILSEKQKNFLFATTQNDAIVYFSQIQRETLIGKLEALLEKCISLEQKTAISTISSFIKSAASISFSSLSDEDVSNISTDVSSDVSTDASNTILKERKETLAERIARIKAARVSTISTISTNP